MCDHVVKKMKTILTRYFNIYRCTLFTFIVSASLFDIKISKEGASLFFSLFIYLCFILQMLLFELNSKCKRSY